MPDRRRVVEQLVATLDSLSCLHDGTRRQRDCGWCLVDALLTFATTVERETLAEVIATIRRFAEFEALQKEPELRGMKISTHCTYQKAWRSIANSLERRASTRGEGK